MEDALTKLTRANAREMLVAFKLERLKYMRPLAEMLASVPARRLSRFLLRFDDCAGRHGLAAAGRLILDEFTRATDFEGLENIPSSGPLLIVSNHPGLVDAMAIWVALESRPDLKTIAAERDILTLFPNVRKMLLFVNPRAECRTGLMRDAARHLRRGGALLTFPAGAIEPDPSMRSVHRHMDWSSSPDLLVRLVPETKVLPVVVSGVISITAHRHLLARRLADPRERDWAAATLQVMCRRFRDTRTRVMIGEPISMGRLPIQSALETVMTSMLDRVPQVDCSTGSTTRLATSQPHSERAAAVLHDRQMQV